VILKGPANLLQPRDLVLEPPRKRNIKPWHFLRLSRKMDQSLKRRPGAQPRLEPRFAHGARSRPR
jgi:hypothetical protein